MTKPLSTLDLGELRIAAENARAQRYIPATRRVRGATKPWPSARDLDRDGFGVWFGEPNDDAYIALLAPSRVLRLLDQYDRLVDMLFDPTPMRAAADVEPEEPRRG